MPTNTLNSCPFQHVVLLCHCYVSCIKTAAASKDHQFVPRLTLRLQTVSDVSRSVGRSVSTSFSLSLTDSQPGCGIKVASTTLLQTRVPLSSAPHCPLVASLTTFLCRVPGFVCVFVSCGASMMGVSLPGSPWSVVSLEAGAGPQGVWLPSDSGSVTDTLAQHY